MKLAPAIVMKYVSPTLVTERMYEFNANIHRRSPAQWLGNAQCVSISWRHHVLFCRLAAQVIGCLNDLFEHCSAAELEELGLKDELEEGNAEFESQCLAQEQWWLSSDGKDQ